MLPNVFTTGCYGCLKNWAAMAVSRTGLRDITVAFLVGFVAESLLAVLSFITNGEITGRHPWLRILQTPGAEISLQLFGRSGILSRFAGVFQAQACAILIQSAIFGVALLGWIYVYRIVTGSRRLEKH
jgi:hypothetical protein